MQISRRILLACATTGILVPLILFADTEAQIKARQALEQKLGLAPSQPAAAATTQATPQTPVAQPTPAVPQTSAAPVKADSAAIEKARRALEQKMRELNGQSQTESPVTTPTPKTPAMTQTAPAQTPEIQAEPVKPLIPNSAAIEKARQALEQKMRELNGQPQSETPATPTPNTEFTQTPAAQMKPSMSDSQTIEKARQALEQKLKELNESLWPKPEESNSATVEKAREAMLKKMAEDQQQKELAAQKAQEQKQNQVEQQKQNPLGFAPIQGPPTGLSPEKEQQLQALLKDYEADKITPEQYHAQRAKILAEP